MGLFGRFKKKEPTPEELLRQGMEHYCAQRCGEAYPLLSRAALLLGDAVPADAAEALGRMLERGEGAPQDSDGAARYYDLAAQHGSAEAMDAVVRLALGNDCATEEAYRRALPYAQRRAEETGADWAKQQEVRLQLMLKYALKRQQEEVEAEHWSPERQFDRGVDYYNGAMMMPKDFAKALYWFEKAAEQGLARAQYNTAMMYDKGWGTEQDTRKAIEWYKKAAAQNHINAIDHLAVIFWNKNNEETEAGHRKEAFYWYCRLGALGDLKGNQGCRKLLRLSAMEPIMKELRGRMQREAEQGGVDEQYFYGYFMRYYGSYAPWRNSEQEAFRWFEQAAAQGHMRAKKELSLMYRNGFGVEKDEAKARALLEEAAEEGLAEAQYSLSLAYRFGEELVEKDEAKAFDLMQRAASQEHAGAQLSLGMWYYYGDAPAREDRRAAAHWLKKAAENGDAAAMRNYGNMLAKGDGIPADKELAREWLRKAADKGDPFAAETLKQLS